MLPPIVPRFWIWTPPTVAHASASRPKPRRTSAWRCNAVCVASAPMRSAQSPAGATFPSMRAHSLMRARSSITRSLSRPRFHSTIRSVPPTSGSASGVRAYTFSASRADFGAQHGHRWRPSPHGASPLRFWVRPAPSCRPARCACGCAAGRRSLAAHCASGPGVPVSPTNSALPHRLRDALDDVLIPRAAAKIPREHAGGSPPGSLEPPDFHPGCRRSSTSQACRCRTARRRGPGTPRCSGLSASGVPSASTVRIDRPSTWHTGIRQLFTGSPSTSTVQAPHSPSPQPSFVPVRPKSSRSTSINRRNGGPSNARRLRLTMKSISPCSYRSTTHERGRRRTRRCLGRRFSRHQTRSFARVARVARSYAASPRGSSPAGSAAPE